MKISQVTKYTCEICGSSYFSPEKAELCESRELSGDKGAKVGDIVLITRGDGAGSKAKITEISVCSREYGHYAWERYWHTVCVVADLIDDFGSRSLLFDDYEMLSNREF